MRLMENLDYWRLCDELTIIHAALLFVGIDPSSETGSECENWKPHERPPGYDAVKLAISDALRRKQINGRLFTIDEGGGINPFADYPVNIVESLVEVESLRTWLAKRGFKNGFFFPERIEAPDYLDPRNPRYAPRLAAAVYAWQAVTDPTGKTPKQALTKWLRENAAKYDLADEDGKLNETGIDEVAKVANWQSNGGAPKTPGR